MEMRFSIRFLLSVRVRDVYWSLNHVNPSLFYSEPHPQTHLLAVADAFLFKAQLPLQVLNDGIFRVLDLGVAHEPWRAGVLTQEPAVWQRYRTEKDNTKEELLEKQKIVYLFNRNVMQNQDAHVRHKLLIASLTHFKWITIYNITVTFFQTPN